MCMSTQALVSSSPTIRYGLVVRIPGSHPGGPGSIPGNGNIFSLILSLKELGQSFWAVHGTFFFFLKQFKPVIKKFPTRMGFEPTRAEHIGLAVQRLNHSATSSSWKTLSWQCETTTTGSQRTKVRRFPSSLKLIFFWPFLTFFDLFWLFFSSSRHATEKIQ